MNLRSKPIARSSSHISCIVPAGDVDYFSATRHFRAMKQNSDASGRSLRLASNFSIPDECRAVAEALFPPGGTLPGRNPAAVGDFAAALGIGAEHRRLVKAERNTEEIRKFLGHFQNNLDLLIQKTWVEKTEESLKEKLQDKVPPFVDLMENGDLRLATEEFGTILDELAYLLFGGQSTGDDFAEYTFRIDIEMGLFWWYGARLGGIRADATGSSVDDENLWALLLIGICYLANF